MEGEISGVYILERSTLPKISGTVIGTVPEPDAGDFEGDGAAPGEGRSSRCEIIL